MGTFITGCGADCESTCEKAQESGCGYLWAEIQSLDPSSTPAVAGCAGRCGDMEARSEAASCTSEHDDYISCLNDQRSVCEVAACGPESDRYWKCLFLACAERGAGCGL